MHGKIYDEWVRFKGATGRTCLVEATRRHSIGPLSEFWGGDVLGGSLGERPEALQKAQDRGSDMRRSSFEDNRDKIYGRPTRLLRPSQLLPAKTICSERSDQLREAFAHKAEHVVTQPSFSYRRKYAIAHGAIAQKRIPPSLFSRVVKRLPSFSPRAPCGQNAR